MKKKVRTFKAPLDSEQMDSMKTKNFAKNSGKCIKWSVKAYQDWRAEAMKDSKVDDRIVLSDLENPMMIVKRNLCFSLCQFITEVKKVEGQDYPPGSLKSLVYGIQMYLATKKLVWQLLDKMDEAFYDLVMVVDNLLKECVSMGMGRVQSAEPISKQMEHKMWESGVLGDSNPKQLSDTLLFLLGIHLALRGVRNKKHYVDQGINCQIIKSVDEDGYECLIYTQDTKAKNHQGGLTTKYVAPKVVYMYLKQKKS